MCEGFWLVEKPLSVVLYEPKYQYQPFGDPEDVSVNCTVRGAVPLVGEAENPTTRGVPLASTTVLTLPESTFTVIVPVPALADEKTVVTEPEEVEPDVVVSEPVPAREKVTPIPSGR